MSMVMMPVQKPCHHGPPSSRAYFLAYSRTGRVCVPMKNYSPDRRDEFWRASHDLSCQFGCSAEFRPDGCLWFVKQDCPAFEPTRPALAFAAEAGGTRWPL